MKFNAKWSRYFGKRQQKPPPQRMKGAKIESVDGVIVFKKGMAIRPLIESG